MRIDIGHPEIFSKLFYNLTKIKLKFKIKGISTDSREIYKDDLFIAIKGNDFDGNNFIREASEFGASAALVSTISNVIKIQQIKVKSPVDTLFLTLSRNPRDQKTYESDVVRVNLIDASDSISWKPDND